MSDATRESDRVRDQPIMCLGPVGLDMIVEGFAPRDPVKFQNWTGPAGVRMLAAGSSGYAAIALHGLGRPVRLASQVGDDLFGAETLAQLSRQGLDTSEINTHPGVTGLAIYLRMFGEPKRPMLFRAADYNPWPDEIALSAPGSQHPPAAVVVSGALHFPDYAARTLGPLFHKCRARGIPTFLDPQFAPRERTSPWAVDFAEVLSMTDVLSCDEREGAQLFGSEDVGDIIDRAHAAGCSTVVVKREHLGAVLDDGSRRIYQPAISLGDGVSSTVGSGDAFIAGLSDQYLADSSLERLGAWSTAVAAVAITHPDGVRGITRESVLRVIPRVPSSQVI